MRRTHRGRVGRRAMYRSRRFGSPHRQRTGQRRRWAGRGAVGRHQAGRLDEAARAAAPGRGTCRRARTEVQLAGADPTIAPATTVDPVAQGGAGERRRTSPQPVGVVDDDVADAGDHAAERHGAGGRGARTAVPRARTAYLSPRLPGHHGHSGSRNGSTTGARRAAGTPRQGSAGRRAGERGRRGRRSSTAWASAARARRLRAVSGADGRDRREGAPARRRSWVRRRRRRSSAPGGGAPTWCGSGAPGSR